MLIRCLAGVLAAGPSLASDEASPSTTTAELRSLPWLGHACTDPRLPLLSGPWALGCKGATRPNRAQHIGDGRRVEFSALGETWGHGKGRIVDLSNRREFQIGDSEAPLLALSSSPHAPLSSDGERILLSSPGKLEWMQIGESERHTIPDADPAPWYAPAISDDLIAWVQLAEKGGQEDVWAFSRSEGRRFPLAEGPEHERHVVAEGEYVAWLTDNAVHLLNRKSGAHRQFEGQFNSNEGLSLSEGVLCWEGREDSGLDIFCSDGLHLERPGDQRRPSRWRDWLLFHEGEDVLLYGPLK